MQSFDLFRERTSMREQAAMQSLILNTLLPGDKRHPLTLCVASSTQLETFRPWPKAFTLQEIGEASKKPFEDDGYITSEEIMAILFQLIWTLAALQKSFPGYQHNSLARSVRIYSYGGARCYRTSDGGGHHVSGTSYYIRKFMPLPVIVTWDTSNSSTRGIDIPFRTEPDEPGKDLNNVFNALFANINYDIPPKEFRLARKLQEECTRYHIKIRRRYADPSELLLQDNEEIYLDKRETGENICIPFILNLQCPPGFESMNTPPGELSTCAKCPPGAEVVKTSVSGKTNYSCSSGTIQLTSELYSTYFNDFLEPIQFRELAFAVVNGF